MSRKLDAKIRDWLPHIFICYFEYESLNTLEIVKHTGGVLRILGDAQTQINEINDVLNHLEENNLLKSSSTERAHYFGIDLESVTYKVLPDFIKLADDVRNAPQSSKDDIVVNYTENNVTYNFNITFAIEKLAEIKAGLFNFL